MKCVDTTFVIDLLHERKGSRKKARELDAEDILITTEINVYELFYGIHCKKGINANQDI